MKIENYWSCGPNEKCLSYYAARITSRSGNSISYAWYPENNTAHPSVSAALPKKYWHNEEVGEMQWSKHDFDYDTTYNISDIWFDDDIKYSFVFRCYDDIRQTYVFLPTKFDTSNDGFTYKIMRLNLYFDSGSYIISYDAYNNTIYFEYYQDVKMCFTTQLLFIMLV